MAEGTDRLWDLDDLVDLLEGWRPKSGPRGPYKEKSGHYPFDDPPVRARDAPHADLHREAESCRSRETDGIHGAATLALQCRVGRADWGLSEGGAIHRPGRERGAHDLKPGPP